MDMRRTPLLTRSRCDEQVIVNCRLLYIIMLSAFNIAMLCLWNPYLQTPFTGQTQQQQQPIEVSCAA